jgi:His-Xaa-Ser system radical SAM maturase HxsC
MCSQPPVLKPDGALVEDLLEAVPLMARETPELIITGGEPTLLHDRLIQLVTSMRDHLPDTAVHLLSNGRLFAYLRYAEKLASIDHPDLMVGIPLYGDTSDLHDFVVQAHGAFDQTLRGIMNLGRYRQPVEIRVVIHRQTCQRLPQLARFIARNLPFVSHVALMGLEVTGYTRLNLDALWIDPFEYQDELLEAVAILDQSGLNTSIYNHQLCLLDESLWPFARQSISDWKNEYLTECETCAVRNECGGFFATGRHRISSHITPVVSADRCQLGLENV